MDSVNLPKLENIVDHSRFIAMVQEEVGYFVKSGSYHLSPLQGYFNCTEEKNFIQLNKIDREKLFGKSLVRFEKGYAVKLD